MVVQIGSAYVSCKTKAPKVCYDCREDDNFSRECLRHPLVNQLWMTHFLARLKLLGVFHDYIDTNHWSKEFPQYLDYKSFSSYKLVLWCCGTFVEVLYLVP